MAQKYVNDVKLRIVFEAGTGTDGMPMLKKKTLSRIGLAVTPDQLYNTALAYSSLSSYPLLEIERLETAGIEE